MTRLLRFMDWPLRAKMATLLVVASLLPLGIGTLVDVREARRRLVANAAALLTARGDQLVRELDTFHRGFQRSATRFARLPRVVEFARTAGGDVDRVKTTIDAVLEVQPGSDPRIRGAAILDSSGRVTAATEKHLVGKNLSYHAYIREALKGNSVVSDIHLEREAEDAPTIAYVEPVRGPSGDGITALLAIWVRATALWDVMKASNGLAGPGSFAVMFDDDGIRIAHTYNDDIVFHPGGPLAPATIDALAAERRFGEKTRQLLEDVRAFPEQFDRSRSPTPDTAVFRGFAPVNQKWNYGVARRFEAVPWTVFYMLPEESLIGDIARMTRQRTLIASAIILLALAAGAGFAAVILRPIRSLSAATGSIARGDLSARAAAGHRDEIGRLGTSFNAMADRIETQATALQRARDDLELRVTERTAELLKTTHALEHEAAERESAQRKLQAQLARLGLLHQITRAIGERQDLHSIFQVVIRSVEDNLPVDFACVCLHDAVSRVLTVAGVGVGSEPLARELALPEEARVPIDENGLSRCIGGELVYEPDVSQVPFPFPRQLAAGGLRSLIVAPLAVESQVFGVFVAARRRDHAFESGECEFLRQLSQHVALASHQAQLYGALQQAYDDLRLTQQAVMQQERLRALGQMASGIAHDINNAISPVSLYTESLLEREPNLSPRARECLETIQHAIDDVGQTVSRMREFYRQREPQLSLTTVDLGRLVRQVVDLSRARWSDMPQQRGVVIELVTELAPDLPAVMGVESEIREALINLVFNAVDSMPEGGTLTLRTTASRDGLDDALVRVEVGDTGVGMDEETRRQCLEPFFTTKGERGTGLGLAMVYGVVKRHSADIEIESAEGSGTTVRLTFPAAATGPLTASADTVAARVPSRLRILVVDDDPMLLKSLRDTLEADGHVIVTANQGRAGIDAFVAARDTEDAFALVITDLGMPYVDGRQVASAVKLASPQTPVILLTGWGQRLVAEGDTPEHVDLVLSKPPKLRELREALAQCSPFGSRPA